MICTEECWFYHILSEHPDMEGSEDKVREAIESPYPPFIYRDKDNPDRHVYYRLDDSRSFYWKAVVDFSKENYGELVTAFTPDSGKTGEIMIWPTSHV